MKLIIAEKPSVAKAIAPVVGANNKKDGFTEGGGYIVSWCFGHLAELYYPDDYGEQWSGRWDFSQLPMIPKSWLFKITKSGKEQFNVLKKLLNSDNVDEVICATDADREGECIFRYVYNLAKCRKPVKRLWVSSLEETAVRNGLNNLKNGSDYDSLYQAGFCRAKADWLVGMNASRLFSIRHRDRLSIGRVQTPTLAMIVKRDNDVKNFVKQKFFTADLDLGGFTASSERIDSEDTANEIVSKCSGAAAKITSVKKEIKSVSPPKLFDLTSLQRESNKKFGYTAQQTLDYLQSLYESKLATYPRTDSQFLSDDMEQTALDVVDIISEKFSFGTVENPNLKRCINNKKVTGHHAIIPTVNIKNADIDSLPEGEKNILTLIANRLICAVAGVHKYESIKVNISCKDVDFTVSGKTVAEKGWKLFDSKIKAKSDGESDEKDSEKSLPELSENQVFENVTAKKSEHFTSPPKSFTEDTLLSAMEHAGAEDFDENAEKKGLGTPATRATTIEGLVGHDFVKREGKKITATEKGVKLISVVPEEVRSPKLTADWENQLLQIERGECSQLTFMNGISEFVKSLCGKYSQLDDSVDMGGNSAIGKCPKCGNDVLKGKYSYYCVGKCGMNVAKVYGRVLTENQLKSLLSGKEISYTANGKKTTVLPEAVENNYNGKTYFQWKTK